jgi:phenylacetaldehyde dehydrogenase
MNALTNDLSKLGVASRNYLAATQRLFIGGRFVESATGRTIPVIDPTSGQEVARVPEGDAHDIDKAVTAARHAFDAGPWPKLRPSQRERIMLRLADLLEQHAQEFSELESVNSGRTLAGTRLIDVNLSVDYLRYMAGWTTKIHGQTLNTSTPYAPDARFFAMTLREPIGVVGAITPWNVPLGQAIWKIAPALATGCTLVLKPAEQTPLTALRFAELIAEAGVPEGVINVVTGFGATAGAALVAHPGVDKISFTGSTAVGRQIGASAAAQMKRFTLELGGKSPMVVMEDADLEIAIPGTAMGIFANHGQNCCAGSRLFVHERIFEQVTHGIVEIAKKIKLGPALDPTTEMGPLISAGQQKRVLEYIASGRSEGAEVLVGGAAPAASGSYVQPTVLTNVNPAMRVVREEIFGPVLVAASFSDAGDVLRRANDTQFGLGASIWTRSLDVAHGFIREFKAGTVWVNTHNVLDLAVPFGGVRQSGTGHELGEAAIEHHTHLKAAILPMRDLR